MQGKKGKESKLFYIVSLNQLVPADHPVRRISEVLDLKFIYTETRQYYSHEGKPSIDPVVLFKLYLIGYFFGIPSERKLFREVQGDYHFIDSSIIRADVSKESCRRKLGKEVFRLIKPTLVLIGKKSHFGRRWLEGFLR